jgi:hypothetical protein
VRKTVKKEEKQAITEITKVEEKILHRELNFYVMIVTD